MSEGLKWRPGQISAGDFVSSAARDSDKIVETRRGEGGEKGMKTNE
jgi:hypothetical protein